MEASEEDWGVNYPGSKWTYSEFLRIVRDSLLHMRFRFRWLKINNVTSASIYY
ncbi:hypothetical protein NC653_034076 [Populus alba x Populus x berolinensis]|uniref:Uncharacterized protein n=1 Tax=Populus alba x Populus x berolinensis TaxID=444605 RepID=A0AAD6LPI0_9ROSI|nr:hypothetical protein NC653_034076 [Populus alba x Populus x berolinensis]